MNVSFWADVLHGVLLLVLQLITSVKPPSSVDYWSVISSKHEALILFRFFSSLTFPSSSSHCRQRGVAMATACREADRHRPRPLQHACHTHSSVFLEMWPQVLAVSAALITAVTAAAASPPHSHTHPPFLCVCVCVLKSLCSRLETS